MTSLWKSMIQRSSLLMLALLSIVLLTGCSGLGGILGSPTPIPPTPTPALTQYQGTDYTISYPQDWKQSTINGQITFQDALGVNTFAIAVVPNPKGLIEPSAALDASLTLAAKKANMTKTSPANLPNSVSVASGSWTQKGEIGTVSQSGVSASAEVVVLATNHPANSLQTKLFELIYAGPLLGSTLIDEQTFQDMLASFKFAS